MKKNLPKSCNLDLKLLDCKFIAIDDNQIYITEAMQSVRRSKISQLPSLIKSHQSNSKHYSNLNTTTSYNKLTAKSYICQDSTSSNNTFLMDHSINEDVYKNLQNTNNFSQIADMENQLTQKNPTATLMRPDYGSPSETTKKLQEIIRTRHIMKRNKSMPSFQQPTDAKADAEKQRTQLDRYHERQEPLKKVRKIQPFSSIQNMKRVDSVFTQTPKQQQKFLKAKASIVKLQKIEQKREADLEKIQSVRKSLNFYEGLNEQTPYKVQIEKLHKKMISSNLHKSFEHYLMSQSKRVPQFIKRIRA